MKGFVLSFVKDNKATLILQREFVQELQRHKKYLKLDPKYAGGKLVIRTIDGFKAKKILDKDIK